MSKLNGKSLNIENSNIKKQLELFPEINIDGKIDFDKLKQILGYYVDDSEERYRFMWNGKGEALRLSQTPSMGTLRPAKEEGESKNWDDTENLYIEGDNLEVLKLLQKSYFNKVKMIYIDPPYNTGGDFVYKDNFKDNIQNYKKITGQVDSEGNATTTNREYSGRYHTDWLNMMYPRLRLARNLLTDDGVLVVHIDEHEEGNLLKILNEVYGEENYLGTIIWNKLNPKGDSNTVSVQHESIILFAKNKAEFIKSGGLKRRKTNAIEMLKKAKEIFNKVGSDSSLEDINRVYSEWIKKQDNLTGGESAYSKIDEEGNIYQAVSMSWPNNKIAPEEYFIPIIHPVTGKECPVPSKGWRNPPKTMQKLLDNKEIVFGKDETVQPRRKYLLKDNLMENVSSMISYGGSDDRFFNKINLNFDNPKPYNLAKQIISFITKENDVILDFFAGSSTTAHATMQLNTEDNGNRKYLMVQLPELIDENSAIYNADYETISEIGKERIRRAGEKTKEELKEKYEKSSDEERKEMKHPDELDIGFKVFQLDSSNIKEWNPGKYENVQGAIEDALTPYVEGRTEEDVIYEMMLKMGLDLTYPVEEHNIDGKTIYSIGYGFLMICLADELDVSIAKKMIEIKNENEQQQFRTIFRDEGFRSDTDKTNIKETLRSAGLADESFITL